MEKNRNNRNNNNNIKYFDIETNDHSEGLIANEIIKKIYSIMKEIEEDNSKNIENDSKINNSNITFYFDPNSDKNELSEIDFTIKEILSFARNYLLYLVSNTNSNNTANDSNNCNHDSENGDNNNYYEGINDGMNNIITLISTDDNLQEVCENIIDHQIKANILNGDEDPTEKTGICLDCITNVINGLIENILYTCSNIIIDEDIKDVNDRNYIVKLKFTKFIY